MFPTPSTNISQRRNGQNSNGLSLVNGARILLVLAHVSSKLVPHLGFCFGVQASSTRPITRNGIQIRVYILKSVLILSSR